MVAFTAASLDLLQEEEDVEEVPREGEQADQEGRQGREHAGGAPLQQPEGWADYFDLPTFPDNDGDYDGLSEQERNELQELQEWQRMQEEAQTEQRRRLELLRRQRALELERVSYPSTRAVLGSQPLGAMGLGSLGVRPGVTTLLGSGTAVRSVPPVVELERRLNERMDMWPTTAQASLHEDVPRGSETPTRPDEPRALEALAAKARKQDEPEAQGGPMTLDKAMITMSSAVAKLATALNESKEASVLKWERKKPTVKMSNPEEFPNELLNLENAYAETGAKS